MGNLLTALIVCGLMGLIGQGTRAVVGLSNSAALNRSDATRQTTFNSAYLFISLVVGFIAGVLAGLALNIIPDNNGTALSSATLLGLIAAGYAGTDFIENTFAKLLPSLNTSAPPVVTPPTVAGQVANEATVQSLAETVQKLYSHLTLVADRMLPQGTTTIPSLAAALQKVLPSLNGATWNSVLNDAFQKYSINTPLRISAAMGQFVAEVNEVFGELRENTDYSSAQLLSIFPNEVKDQATADRLAGHPVAIANYIYANRQGNGGEASGDGFKFRGGGLCQLTGRKEYTDFAAALGMDVDHAAAYVATAEGAAISGSWYFNTNGCLPLADQWKLTKITDVVNGGGMEALAERIDYSNRFRNAFGTPMPDIMV